MTKKGLLLVSIAFLPLTCVAYSYDQIQTPAHFMPKSKVALIGFYPYSRKLSRTEHVGYREYEKIYKAVPVYNQRYKKALGFGKPIADFPVSGERRISSEEYKRIFGRYHDFIQRSGLREIERIAVPARGNSGEYILKLRDVDFYLIGDHGPAFKRCDRTSPTFLLWFFTLGTFPLYGQCYATSRFYLYDRNFQLQKTLVYQTTIKSKTAWWVQANPPGAFFIGGRELHSPPYFIIENDARKLARDLRGQIP